MSVLSMLEERITSHSEVCKCGRKIMRDIDKANGVCRLCNPFSLSNENRNGTRSIPEPLYTINDYRING